jgi:hypothetical protein
MRRGVQISHRHAGFAVDLLREVEACGMLFEVVRAWVRQGMEGSAAPPRILSEMQAIGGSHVPFCARPPPRSPGSA